MKGMFKRALAGVAAAALAATGLALGAGAANAAEGDPVTFTFTGTSDQLKSADMHAYKIADYVSYGTNPVVYGVETAGDDTNVGKIAQVLETATAETTPSYDVNSGDDPMTWVLAQSPALLGTDGVDWGYENGVAASTVRMFANALAEAGLTEVEDAEFVTADGQITVDLAPGVYLFTNKYTDLTGKVTQTVPMLLASGTVSEDHVLVSDQGGNTTVEMKNSVNTPQTKNVTEDSASIGDTLHYTLSGVVSSTVANEFSFKDTPGVGLTVNLPTDAAHLNGFSVAVYNVDENGDITGDAVDTLDYGTDYTVESALRKGNMGGEVSEGVMGTFTVKVHGAYQYAGQAIVVKYTTIVNDEADVDAETGVVNALDNYGDQTETTVDTKFYEFGIHKTDKDGKNLGNVSFEVKETNEEGTETGSALYFVKQGDGSYKKVYDTATVDGESTTVTTDAKGAITLKGLGEGYYQVTETENKNPGYILTDKNVVFTVHIDENGAVTVYKGDTWGFATNTDADTIVEVLNIKSVTQLPLTGAAGTALFTVLGLLIAGAGALAYMKSRNVKHALRG